MSDREKSYLSYGLSALAIICATLLRALGAVEPSFLLYVFGLAFSALGFYHAPGPGGAGGKMPPPAAAALLALLGLGQAGCGPVVVVEADEILARLGRGLLGPRAQAEQPSAQSVSITPITSLSGPASGFSYSGASYIVSCSVSGSVTLYPVVHNGTAWEPPYTSYGCALSSTIAPSGSCWFPARQGTGLTWNAYQTGSGSVVSCTAIGSATPVPASRSASSGGGGGTVTSIDCLAGLTCTPDPIVGAGTIAPDFGTAVGQVVQGGVVAAGSCAYPASVTYNAAGQVTGCTAGSAPAVTGLADPTAQVGLSAVNGVATTAMRSDAAPALNQGISPTWSGTHTFSNTITLGAGAGITGSAGAGALSLGSLTGDTTLPTGFISYIGASNKTVSLTTTGASGTITIKSTAGSTLIQAGNVRLQSAAGSDALWITGTSSVSVYAGDFTTPASTVNFSWGSSTGNFTFPKGAISWTGATDKSIALAASGAAGTALLSTSGTGAHITIRAFGSSSFVINDGTTGVVLRRNGSTQLDVGNTSSSAVTLGANVSLNGAAGSGGLSLGSMTGDTTLPTGAVSWTGAFGKAVALTASGAAISLTGGGAASLSINTSWNLLGDSGGTGTLSASNGVRIMDGTATALLVGVGSTSGTAGIVTIAPSTSPPAGGSTSARFRLGSSSTFGVYFGSGAPTVSAGKGSLYLRTDGSGTSDRMYVNTDGSTGWTAVTTAT